jgi:hypothetical protein
MSDPYRENARPAEVAFKRGDLVKHLTGGPTMVVRWIEDNNGAKIVTGAWFQDGAYHKQEMRPWELVKA